MKGFELKCYPRGLGRKVYRVIQIGDTASLDELCLCILDSLNLGEPWEHLYEIVLGTKLYKRGSYCIPCPRIEEVYEYNSDGVNTDLQIGALHLYKGYKFMFHYDFGDDIVVMINVTKRLEELSHSYPLVVKEQGMLGYGGFYDDEDDETEE
ncbi:MAG: hypothetical protein IJ228_06305 [Succinivibrio sp.]|nr:hypothetical protein [Succinivibrio sp.]